MFSFQQENEQSDRNPLGVWEQVRIEVIASDQGLTKRQNKVSKVFNLNILDNKPQTLQNREDAQHAQHALGDQHAQGAQLFSVFSKNEKSGKRQTKWQAFQAFSDGTPNGESPSSTCSVLLKTEH